MGLSLSITSLVLFTKYKLVNCWMSLAEKTQFRSKGLPKENHKNLIKGNEKKPENRAEYESEDYYEEGSSLEEAEMSVENPSTLPTPKSLDATKLLSCFMKDFDFGSNYDKFIPNLRYEKCYLACKQEKGS